MNKVSNKWAVKTAWMGCIAVCAFAAGLVLLFSGQRHQPVTGNAAAAAFADGRPAATAADHRGNAAAGQRKYLLTCAACHGIDGQGQPHQGANLNDSRFVRESTDESLVGDPRSVLGLTMPPLGGNPNLDEGQVRDIVAYLRTLQSRSHADAGPAN
jgi:mono/diheme cytochrome c family protein